MRRSRCTETNIILFLLAVTPVFIALLCSGCSMHNIREDPNAFYRGYDGQKLPEEEVAMVWWGYYPRTISIDGKTLEIKTRLLLGAELLPGQHTMEVSVQGRKAVPATINIDADLSGGHVYRFEYKNRLYAQEPVDYAVSLIDEETGALVAGRPPEVLKWSWSDWEQAIQRLKRDSATEKQTIELLSEPVRYMCDNIAVYLFSRKRGLIRGWPIYVLPPKHGGFLFVEFDASHRLQNHVFVEAPFRKCFRNPFTAWDTDRWYSEYEACWSRLEENACDEFRAVTGRSVE